MTRITAHIALASLTVERDDGDSDPTEAFVEEISRIAEKFGAKPVLAKAGANVFQMPTKRRAVGQ